MRWKRKRDRVHEIDSRLPFKPTQMIVYGRPDKRAQLLYMRLREGATDQTTQARMIWRVIEKHCPLPLTHGPAYLLGPQMSSCAAESLCWFTEIPMPKGSVRIIVPVQSQ